MNMLELAMCDIWQIENSLVGFHGQHVFANREGDVAKEVGENGMQCFICIMVRT
jgi:hypothetical protein